MSTDGRSNSMDRISELPKDILHRILYFLSQEDAVRTSVLSKSWRHIWFARTNLDFSDITFKGKKREFLFIVKNNLQRYRDQRMSLEEFHLRISLGNSHHESVSLLEKWIPLLTNMGVKKFCLSIRRRYYTPRHVELPPLIFGAESLHELYIENFTLDQKAIQRMVPFNHLRELRLERVSVEDEIFQQIISSCPLIETMFLEWCKVLQNIKVSNLHHLKKFSFYDIPVNEEERCSIEFDPLSLETVDIVNGNVRFHKGSFCNLKDIYMHGVKSWDHMLSCKFPSLEWLTIANCDGLKENKVLIDAPNINYFSYRGDFIPSISFATTTSRWLSSYINLKYLPSNDASSWFFKLTELLESLSRSRIYLSIYEYSMNDEDTIQENIHDLVQDNDGCADKPVDVEWLHLDCHLSSFLPSLLNRAFSVCRPRIISEYYSSRWKIDDIECLWKILMERGNTGDQDDQFKNALWLQDLEEVSMEIYDENRKGWHSITLSELPNCNPETGSNLLFELKWRELPSVRSLIETNKVDDLEDLRIENHDRRTEPVEDLEDLRIENLDRRTEPVEDLEDLRIENLDRRTEPVEDLEDLRIENLDRRTEAVEDLEDLRIENLDRRTEPVGTWDKLVRICNCFCIP